ncbi:MAG: hypothetical protein LBD12_05850 [Clostridiales Family XIII bacterium]|jgi:hypothetical protein|nr:hypothetical protein [Clostridiales Family XIII bacterium]
MSGGKPDAGISYRLADYADARELAAIGAMYGRIFHVDMAESLSFW